MTLKKSIGQLHLWLGLASGLVIFVIGLTGCILVFEQEIRYLTNTSNADMTVPLVNSNPANPSVVFKKALAGVPPGGVRMYYYKGEKENNVITNWYYHPGSDVVKKGYIEITQNPYTGEVIKNQAWEGGFWGFVVSIHTTLLLPAEIGHQVVSWSTVIFLVMLISGLVLWYPKSEKGLKQRFAVRWKASPKRLNYDLHNVLGFYMTWVVIFTVLTGLIFSFTWFREGVYFLATGGEKMENHEEIKSTLPPDYRNFPISKRFEMIDSATRYATSKYVAFRSYMVSYPMDSMATIDVGIQTINGKNYDRHDEFSFDQYTGQLLHAENWSDQNAGERILHLNYAIHVGSVGGLATKFLAFFASLIASSLPVTGFYIWWGRGRKKQQETEKQFLLQKLSKKKLKPARFQHVSPKFDR